MGNEQEEGDCLSRSRFGNVFVENTIDHNEIYENVLYVDERSEGYVFSPGIGVAIGKEVFFGKRKRLIADFQIGLQGALYPDKLEITRITDTYLDQNGDITNVNNYTEEQRGSFNSYFDEIRIWYVFGAGSIIAPRVRIGYNF